VLNTMDWIASFVYLICSILFVIISLYLYQQYVIWRYSFRFKDGTKVPGPPPSFVLGNVRALSESKNSQFQFHEWRKQYGDVIQVWLAFKPILFVEDLEVIRSISSSKDFFGRDQSHAVIEAFHDKGIIFSNNEEHHKVHRAVVLKGLMKPSYLKGVSNTITEMTSKQFQNWNNEVGPDKPIHVQVYYALSALALDIIGVAGFSTDLKTMDGGESEYAKKLYDFWDCATFFTRLPYIAKFLYFFQWRRFKRAISYFDHYGLQLLKQRRASKETDFNDFMDFLVTETDPKTGREFTDMEIVLDIHDLLSAGHETTSNTLGFAFYFLANNPDIQTKLQEEAAKFSERPSYTDSSKMEVANAVVKETLRMFAVVPFLIRKCSNDTVVKFPNGKEIPVSTGSGVMISMHCVGRDERYFEDPDKFNIDRWLNKDEESTNPAWIPFGLGARSCVGSRMAMLEAKLILCMVMQKYTVRPSPKMNGPLQTETVLTARPMNLILQFIPRKN